MRTIKMVMVMVMVMVVVVVVMVVRYHLNCSVGLSLDSPPLLPHREFQLGERLKEDCLFWGWTGVGRHLFHIVNIGAAVVNVLKVAELVCVCLCLYHYHHHYFQMSNDKPTPKTSNDHVVVVVVTRPQKNPIVNITELLYETCLRRYGWFVFLSCCLFVTPAQGRQPLRRCGWFGLH